MFSKITSPDGTVFLCYASALRCPLDSFSQCFPSSLIFHGYNFTLFWPFLWLYSHLGFSVLDHRHNHCDTGHLLDKKMANSGSEVRALMLWDDSNLRFFFVLFFFPLPLPFYEILCPVVNISKCIFS